MEDAVALAAHSGVKADLTVRIRPIDDTGAVVVGAECDGGVADDEPTAEIENVIVDLVDGAVSGPGDLKTDVRRNRRQGPAWVRSR